MVRRFLKRLICMLDGHGGVTWSYPTGGGTKWRCKRCGHQWLEK